MKESMMSVSNNMNVDTEKKPHMIRGFIFSCTNKSEAELLVTKLVS